MLWLLYIVLALALFWGWFFFGSRAQCPNCGVELHQDWARPGRRIRRCPCGWTA
jgi:hypothetical protein